MQPTVTEGLHNTSYDFSPEDIRQLKIVAALRAAEFSMADIREIQQHPEKLPHYLEDYREKLDAEIRRKQSLAEALDRLSSAESGSLEAVANSMRPAQRQELENPSSPAGGIIMLIVVLAVLGLYLLSSFWKAPIMALIPLGMIPAFGGMVSIFMAYRYATCTHRAAKLPNRATAAVVSVAKETGYDAAYSIKTTATIGAPRWGGQGGIWTLFFMIWGELRPDHWVPILQFTDRNGKLQSGEFLYGGLKHHFKEGEQVEVAWDKYPYRVLPLYAPWLSRKAAAYFLLGTVLLAAGGTLFLKVIDVVVKL